MDHINSKPAFYQPDRDLKPLPRNLGPTQTFLKPLIKEYTSNHNKTPYVISGRLLH